MTRKLWLLVIAALLLGDRFSHAEEHPLASWCIPAIQREAATNDTAQPVKNGENCGIFDESLEATADKLYQEAVKLDVDGQSTRAAEKFVTLLDQCPSYRHRKDVVKRLTDRANTWLEEAREHKWEWHEETCLFVVPTSSLKERAAKGSEIEARARKVLDMIQQTALRKINDPETYLWDLGPHVYPEGWDWLEDVKLEVPGFHGPDSVFAPEEVMFSLDRDYTPSRRWFSPKWRRQIMMQLQCESNKPCEKNSAPDDRFKQFGISGVYFEF